MSRLETLLALVPESAATVADVGYDHGLVLRALLRRRPAVRCIGVERQQAAAGRLLRRIAGDFEGAGERLALRTGSGFEPLARGEVDAAVVAGLGERTILALVRRGDELGSLPTRLVLAPAGLETELRPGLAALGWRVVDERLARERGRFREILAFERGAAAAADPVAARWGALLLDRPDPLAAAFLADVARRMSGAVAAALRLRAAGRERGGPLLTKLATLREATRRVRTRRCPADPADPAPAMDRGRPPG